MTTATFKSMSDSQTVKVTNSCRAKENNTEYNAIYFFLCNV